jgi:hypothetical protein
MHTFISEFTVNKQLISSNLLCEALILKVLKEINLYTIWHGDLYRVSPFQVYRTSTSCLPCDLQMN